MNTSFRIGFLINENGEIPAWEAQMIKQLLNSGTHEIVFISGKPVNQPPLSAGYRLFQKFENWWFRSAPDAYKRIQVAQEFSTIKAISSSDPILINAFDPDIIYCSIMADPKNARARLGIWSVRFGDVQNPLPPAFAEVMNNKPVTRAVLYVQNESEKSSSVYDCETLTIPYSVKNNLNSIAWKASSFFPHRLRELSIVGADSFFSKYKTNNVIPVGWKSPGTGQMLLLFLKNLFGYLGYKTRKLVSKKNFTLLYLRQAFAFSKIILKGFTSLVPPVGAFWADPFILNKDGRNYVFFEEQLADSQIAHLSVLEIDEAGNPTKPVTILQRPYHLSYPFVFEWEGNYYMLPETSSNRTVELYKATLFPYEWELAMNLMEDTILIDPTLVFEKNKWWLFGTTQNHPFTSTNDQLLLFYSDELLSSNWVSHSANPIATKISNCRPAGRIFMFNNELYRPAQNNASRQYGYALNLNKIELLNEYEYKESIVHELLPGKENGLQAVHTLNFTEDLIVIDGVRV